MKQQSLLVGIFFSSFFTLIMASEPDKLSCALQRLTVKPSKLAAESHSTDRITPLQTWGEEAESDDEVMALLTTKLVQAVVRDRDSRGKKGRTKKRFQPSSHGRRLFTKDPKKGQRPDSPYPKHKQCKEAPKKVIANQRASLKMAEVAAAHQEYLFHLLRRTAKT